MPNEILDLNTAWTLDIIGVFEGNSFQFQLQRFSDDALTIPEDWPAVPYTMAISDQENGDPNLLKMSTTSGEIVRVTNTLSITCIDTKNALIGGADYFYDIVADLGGGLTRVEGRGKFTVQYSIVR